jgi:hypothetical protein
MMMMMASPAGRTTRPAGGHVRSASVPSQRHPLLTHVDDQLRALRSWTSDPGQNPLALAHVRALLCVLDELLQHYYLPPSPTDDRLLDGFLALADAYGSFLAALLALRQNAAELRSAVRRRDPAKLASAARAQRGAAKELAGLAAAVARCAPVPTHALSAAGASSKLDVARTVAEAVVDTAAASASVFHQVASLAEAAASTALAVSSSSSKKRIVMVGSKAAAGEDVQRDAAAAAAVAKLQELEQCVGELESESEKVFRSLLQTRVSLLNIHTPTI